MRKLTEAEINAMENAFDAWRETQSVDIWQAAFVAGLDYQQSEIERLRTALKMVKSIVTGDDIVYFSESEVAQIDAALGKGL